ncbi:MAG: ribosome biogenesis GTP-binding protein YihA/YsxC [Saprospiraceae bacterium]|nr:ribosome biogenesis GTP-binding protein YihA/YsxC [Saprospiraceae bacterium]MDW8485258.1 ribosome biogenesis GTP-binding protein YihA/YsxC [Saprospiraceae bacterium]
MEIHKAEFVSSFSKEEQCPETGWPEFAFTGRSNVGKSSLINMLTGRKGLAKVSATPGKTQMINFFNINDRWYLVDLPGYGYAKVPKGRQQTLAQMVKEYLIRRRTLALAFMLVDANIPPKRVDLDFANALGEWQVPFAIVFTKTDRYKKGVNQADNIAAFLQALSQSWEPLPPYFLSSTVTGAGRSEILNFIEKTLRRIPHKVSSDQ